MVNKLTGLEAELASYAFDTLNLNATGGFRDCTMPNEFYPEKIADHLQEIPKGVLVSCGSERSFFTAIHCPSGKCEALLVLDVHARIKAYVDFNILLLRISRNRTEYAEWVNYSLDKTNKIFSALTATPLPLTLQLYYMNNFTRYAEVFYKAAEWRTNELSHYFSKSRYDLNDDQFNILQKLAQEGNIVACHRSINDLSLLKHRNISVVNTSNITSYTFINLAGLGDSKPRIICTSYSRNESGAFDNTFFHSHLYTPLTAEQADEFDSLNSLLYRCYQDHNIARIINIILEKPIEKRNLLDDYRFAINCPQTLSLVKEYVQQNILNVPFSQPIDLTIESHYVRINLAKNRLLHDPNLTKHLKRIVANWRRLERETLEIFSNHPRWKYVVKSYFTEHPEELEAYKLKGGTS